MNYCSKCKRDLPEDEICPVCSNPTPEELKPTDKEIAMIANAYCRLQFGIKKCSECPAFNCACSWLREKIIPITAVEFAISAWNKRS